MRQSVTGRRGQARDQRRQLVERALARDQCVELRALQKPHDELHAPRVAPARALRVGHGADLRRFELQAPAVERAAERHRRRVVPIPARLDDRRLDGGELERRRESCAFPARVHDDVCVAPSGGRGAERHTERARCGGLALVDVDELDLGRGDARREPCDDAADCSGADDRDAVADARRCVPQHVDRGLDVRREHGARGRHVVGQSVQRSGGRDVARLMRIEAEHAAAGKRARPLLDDADVAVAVLHGPWKLARLEWRAHALVFAARHFAVEDQRFGPAADAGVERAHERFVGGRRAQRLRPNLAALRLGDPERARFNCRFRHLVRGFAVHGARARILANRPVGVQASRPMAAPRALEVERRARAQPGPWPRGAAVAIVLAAAATVGAAALLTAYVADGAIVLRAAVLAAAGGTLLLFLAVRRLRTARFGAANAVTLARAAIATLLIALLGTAPTQALAWVLVGLGTLGVALDGVDGALARRRAEASDFGARFDMETDALLILVLAALVWQHGKAGAWILAAGLLRYLFVAASWPLPWLGAALPPSRRRQAVCVIQIVSLIGALAPFVVPPWSAALVLAGLIALVWSFAVDVHWLARHARS